jgi:spermidine synthase
LILALFLFSGVSGLIYEVVWSRMFVLVLGSTVYAVSTVLGVFMGGLALGSWLFGRLADRPGASGLRLYGWLELGIGVYALVLPLLMGASDVAYRGVWPLVADSFAGLTFMRVLMAAFILTIPAALMGGTLPVLSRFLIKTRERTGREIGGLYAINTLGAVAGCLLAGFVLLEWLGVRGSLLAAAGLNLVVGTLALAWSRRVSGGSGGGVAEAPPANVRRYEPWQIRAALVLYAFSGLAALALEVLWTRSLMYFTSVDTYAFAAMLAAFLTGIGVGSLLVAPFVSRVRHPLLVLGGVQLGIGLTAALSIPLFSLLYGLSDGLASLLPPATLLSKIVTKLSLSFLVMLVPTLLMGAAFPLISAVYVGARQQVGRGVGTLYALNTVGAIVGSVLAGFVLIPLVGLQQGIMLCASLYVLLGMILVATAPRRRGPRTVAVAASVVGAVVVVALNVRFDGQPMILQSAYFKNREKAHRLVHYHEGASASLAVLENPAGVKLLNINGITTAINNHDDMQVHRMLSHLPLLMHPSPRLALIVGFGMGSTPWGCCQHPELERVDVVELLRSERETAPMFEDVNHGVLDHPKLSFIVGDGRNYLLATRERYDMVSFNAIHPRYSAYLYTRDFYDLCRQRLTDDGVICAWMTQNSMRDVEFRMLCRSFVEVFPHATLWYCNPEHFCLIGTMQPTRIDLAAWQQRMDQPAVRRDLADSGLERPLVLLSRYLLGPAALAQYVAGAPLNTDDRPRIEFARETRADHRLIIERLVERDESAAPIVTDLGETGGSALRRHEQAAREIMLGQVKHWYPRPDESRLEPEMHFRRALLLCPESEDVRYNLAFSTSVKEQVRETLQNHPTHPGALTRAGAILLEEGRLAQAEQYLTRALAQDRGFVPAAEHLGLVYLFGGRPEAGVSALSAVNQAKGGQDLRVRYALSRALELAGRSEEAADHRDAALSRAPELDAWLDLYAETVMLMRSQYAATAQTP